jgi:hemolysin activation/secretion protein
VSGYATLSAFTFAVRLGTATNFGNDFEFYQGNTIGGSTNLRGFRRDRFSGKTTIYQNTEVRWNLGIVNLYILKGQVGLLGFSDVGRVWMPNEESNTLHWGYGGGLFFVPYNKIAFTITYGASTEDQLVTLKAGFLF